MRQSNIVVVLLAFAGIQACSAAPDAPSNEMKLTKTCLKTVCEERSSSNASACARCLDACSRASYSCNSSSACEVSCGGHDCTDGERNQCDTEGFKVTLPNNPSAELEAACKRQLAHIAACGYRTETTAKSCAAFAAVELPERAANYDCFAGVACEDFSSQEILDQCRPAPSTFGDELCATMNGKCADSCDDKRRVLLNDEGAWLRTDAMAAARSCMTHETCSDVTECVSAWLVAVQGK